jgi:hypothetical protein
VHHPEPRPSRPTARPRPRHGAGLTAELATAVASARRRALRDGDRQVDTAHLLHSLVQADPEVRAALGPGSRSARVLGYLVQRSIGYGLGWRGSVEGGAGASADAGPPAAGTAWSPAAAAALDGAGEQALREGRECASGTDVLAQLLADPDCRAMEVLRRAGAGPAPVHGGAAGPHPEAGGRGDGVRPGGPAAGPGAGVPGPRREC